MLIKCITFNSEERRYIIRLVHPSDPIYSLIDSRGFRFTFVSDVTAPKVVLQKFVKWKTIFKEMIIVLRAD